MAISREATAQEVKGFVLDVDEFMAKYAKLVSPETRAKVYASGSTQLIDEYESKVSQGRLLKNSIEATTGAWLAFKREWSKVTDITSTVIGDVVDWWRGLWGEGPAGDLGVYGIRDVVPISGGQLGALGAIPLLTYAVIAGLTAAVLTWIKGVDKLFVWIDAWAIKKDNPNISTEEALDRAAQIAARDNFLAGAALPLIAAAAIVAFLMFGKKT